MEEDIKTVAIIVAHPDDETMWAGGTILNNPKWLCFVICLCRKSDNESADKFAAAVKSLGAHGVMGDLDDCAEQKPLPENEVQAAILELMPPLYFDLIITHSINGEYTRHRRHEEVGRAVIQLWHSGRLSTGRLWAFAYEDGNSAYHPVTIENAPVCFVLPHQLWEQKYRIITRVYGFKKDSWEAKTTPKEEAFWQFYNPEHAHHWLLNGYLSTSL